MLGRRTSKRTKLASTTIWGVGSLPLDETAIRKQVENTLGIFCCVKVQIEKGEQVRIEINPENEMMEANGLMQVSVFNVLRMLCQKFSLQILHVENEFLPDYA
ncbi:hypothetical protein [Flagellimonas meishanensis]|uniref:hypothetical protein n=1 Tax=Flagellimonas meishanensis TaxID=2873264 RepID=UPI001CA6F2BE|nr:hypothetical protein [[Muricauda] meishanensis]